MVIVILDQAKKDFNKIKTITLYLHQSLDIEIR